MFIAHKSNQILSIDENKWNCRRKAKGIKTFDEYWTWEKTITDSDGVITYPSEDFTIVECTDEDGSRIEKLMSYISFGIDFPTYNIKYYVNKRNAEEILDSEGKSHSPKQYVQSHFVPDDSAKDERLLADKWANVRRKRNQKLAETDYLALGDNTLSADMKKYRQDLRDVPSQSDPDDITWPTKP